MHLYLLIFFEASFKESDLDNLLFSRHEDRPERGFHWNRPVLDPTKPIVIEIELGLRSLIDVDERAQSVRLSGFFYIIWRDEIHVWNTTHPANCVKYVVVAHGPSSGIWIPDVIQTNS